MGTYFFIFFFLISLFCTAQKEKIANQNILLTPTYTGNYYQYYPGDVKVAGKYINGKKEGIFYYYNSERLYESRPLDSMVTYENDKRNGLKIAYGSSFRNKSGGSCWNAASILYKEFYKNDLRNGESIYWDCSRQLNQSITYKDGKIVRQIQYPKDSMIIDIRYRLKPFYKDSIDVTTLKKIDSITLEVYAEKLITEEWNSTANNYLFKSIRLENAGYRIKSFLISVPDQELSINGNAIPKSKFNWMVSGENHFLLSNVIVIDKYNKEYALEDKQIYIIQ
jgi:hypothetical protein